MAKHLQYVPDEAKKWTDSKGRPIAIAEVTVSVIMRMFLLKPTPHITELILGVIGRAQQIYDFEIYAYAFLSNHGSYLIGVRSSEHLSDIKCYIHGNIALEVLRRKDCHWKGPLYARPGRSIIALNDEDVIDRLHYICSNSTKEHLVTHPSKWPGAHSAKALCSGKNDRGVWIDRTATNKVIRNSNSRRKRAVPITITYEVKLSQVPPLAHMTTDEYRTDMRAMCDQIADSAAYERQETGQRVMGLKRIMRLSPTHRPDDNVRTPAPIFHCRDLETRKRFIKAYREFVEAYRIANWALRRGLLDFDFPNGGHPPVSCKVPKDPEVPEAG